MPMDLVFKSTLVVLANGGGNVGIGNDKSQWQTYLSLSHTNPVLQLIKQHDFELTNLAFY